LPSLNGIFELSILLPQPPDNCNYRYALPPHLRQENFKIIKRARLKLKQNQEVNTEK
jgi:hypothetical protein